MNYSWLCVSSRYCSIPVSLGVLSQPQHCPQMHALISIPRQISGVRSLSLSLSPCETLPSPHLHNLANVASLNPKLCQISKASWFCLESPPSVITWRSTLVSGKMGHL